MSELSEHRLTHKIQIVIGDKMAFLECFRGPYQHCDRLLVFLRENAIFEHFEESESITTTSEDIEETSSSRGVVPCYFAELHVIRFEEGGGVIGRCF